MHAHRPLKPYLDLIGTNRWAFGMMGRINAVWQKLIQLISCRCCSTCGVSFGINLCAHFRMVILKEFTEGVRTNRADVYRLYFFRIITKNVINDFIGEWNFVFQYGQWPYN